MDHATDVKPAGTAHASLKILAHNLYEYDKGVRQMFMMTLGSHDADVVIRRLRGRGIDYYVHPVSTAKTNLFFGRAVWIDTVREVVRKPLNQLSPQEDFILGILLGYDKELQCRRFLSLKRTDGADAGQRETTAPHSIGMQGQTVSPSR